ncbi:MAG: hypothetical protein PF482_16070, partial [Desulfobacteraceae bacterium]|nr:hypothetical protein [Desulfobacteraceae bacterium]
MLRLGIKIFKYLTLFVVIIFGSLPQISHAAFVEQMAICSKTISMANTCTADPPGMMSIHCNPAG